MQHENVSGWMSEWDETSKVAWNVVFLLIFLIKSEKGNVTYESGEVYRAKKIWCMGCVVWCRKDGPSCYTHSTSLLSHIYFYNTKKPCIFPALYLPGSPQDKHNADSHSLSPAYYLPAGERPFQNQPLWCCSFHQAADSPVLDLDG